MNKREAKLYQQRKGTVTIPMKLYFDLVSDSVHLAEILNDEDENWTYVHEGGQ